MASPDIDESMADGLMSGTFRWSKNKKFTPLPKFPSSASSIEVGKGWGAYLRTRDPTGSLVAVAQRDSSLLDCLTFPISLVYWIRKLGICDGGENCTGALNVVVLGATSKAEERVLNETRLLGSCWQEVGLLLPGLQVNLSMIGPEVSGDTDKPKLHSPLPPNLTIKLRRMDPPCAKRALEKEPQVLMPAARSLFVTYNGGFGNFVDSGHTGLLWSWMEDLRAVAESEVASVFFCANDYADVRGETAVHANLVGSRFLVRPQLNPYHAGSTFQGEQDGSWFCANHSVYAIRGCDPGRRGRLERGGGAEARRRNDAAAMRSVAAAHEIDWSSLMAPPHPPAARHPAEDAGERRSGTSTAQAGAGAVRARHGAGEAKARTRDADGNAGKAHGAAGARTDGGAANGKAGGGGGKEANGDCSEERERRGGAAGVQGGVGEGERDLASLADEFEALFAAASQSAASGEAGREGGAAHEGAGATVAEAAGSSQQGGRGAEALAASAGAAGACDGGEEWKDGKGGRVQYTVAEEGGAVSVRVRAVEEGLDVRQLCVEASDGEVRVGAEGGEWWVRLELGSIDVDAVSAKYLRKSNHLVVRCRRA